MPTLNISKIVSVRISTFLATKTAWELATANAGRFNSHPLFADMGNVVKRPYLPLFITIIDSILVAYVTLSILYLGFRSSKRTWTTTLSPLAMMLLTRGAADRLPRTPIIFIPNLKMRRDWWGVCRRNRRLLGIRWRAKRWIEDIGM